MMSTEEQIIAEMTEALAKTEPILGLKILPHHSQREEIRELLDQFLRSDANSDTKKGQKVQISRKLKQVKEWRNLALQNGYPKGVMDGVPSEPKYCWKVEEEHWDDVMNKVEEGLEVVAEDTEQPVLKCHKK
ncbi:hypothetical protein JX266_013641 [Neoarthrinium moseri]|nr:hypothetical protein JX266_013641 [Neoarthrinium moseri]